MLSKKEKLNLVFDFISDFLSEDTVEETKEEVKEDSKIETILKRSKEVLTRVEANSKNETPITEEKLENALDYLVKSRDVMEKTESSIPLTLSELTKNASSLTEDMKNVQE